jgi:ornithine cyclodeaminase/alanine dehydrogenase-like protein (mu-crystallin family)
VRHVSEADVERLLTPAAARAAVETCFDRLARGAVDSPPRQRVVLADGAFAAMQAVDRELGVAGVKSYLWRPGGAPFVLVLYRLDPPEPLAVVEAARLGELRTAAASAVVATRLARLGAASLGVIGCGRQGAAHVVALREALPLQRVVAHCRDEARRDDFCRRLGCEPGTAAEAGAQDVVVTATTAREPVLRGAWLRPGALVLAIGANDPDARELDDDVLRRADLVCTDSLAQARLESGDLAGFGGDVREVHDVRARPGDDAIVVFKSNGLAAWDVAAGAALL